MSEILEILKDKNDFNERLVCNAHLKLINETTLIIKCNKTFYNQDSLLMFFLFIFPLICLFFYVLFIKLVVLIFWCIFFLLLFFIILFFGHWSELPPDWEIDKERAIATYEKTFFRCKKSGIIKFSEIEYLITRPSDQFSKDSLKMLVNKPFSLKEILVNSGNEKGCRKLGIDLAELTNKRIYHKRGTYKERIYP